MKTRMLSLVATLACWFVTGAAGVNVAYATELACGQTVTSSVQLETDLTCTVSALVIAADNVTVDLGGHTLVGTMQSQGDPRWSGVKTLRGTSLSNIRVTNGTIVGFNRGIDVRGASRVVVQNVTIREPAGNLGIYVFNSADVDIRNVELRGLGRDQGGTGIRLDSVANADAKNVDVEGFGSGALLTSCLTASVKDSFFTNISVAVGVGASTDVMVAGNYVTHAQAPDTGGGGIFASSPAEPVQSLRVVDNTVTNSDRGIGVGSITGAWIAGNTVLDNLYGGIELSSGSTGNKITSNTALGNGIDLFRDDSSFPNTWVDNVFQTYSHPDMVSELPARKCAEVPAGVVSWWPGKGARDIVGSNSGEFLAGARLVNGLVGQAFQFDGSGASLEAPDHGMPYGNAPRSVELWIRPEPNARFPFIYGEPAGDNAFYPIVMDANICIGQWGGGDQCGSMNVVDGAWHHIALTYDGESTATLYLDGNVEVVWPGKSYATTPGGGRVYLGSNFVYTGDPETFAGLVDEVSVYDRALLRGEILAIYLAGSAGKCTGGFAR